MSYHRANKIKPLPGNGRGSIQGCSNYVDVSAEFMATFKVPTTRKTFLDCWQTYRTNNKLSRSVPVREIVNQFGITETNAAAHAVNIEGGWWFVKSKNATRNVTKTPTDYLNIVVTYCKACEVTAGILKSWEPYLPQHKSGFKFIPVSLDAVCEALN